MAFPFRAQGDLVAAETPLSSKPLGAKVSPITIATTTVWDQISVLMQGEDGSDPELVHYGRIPTLVDQDYPVDCDLWRSPN